ncbi:MAG: DUF971 domain-containing protein [Planctomycetota bacterium]|nr:DUF971 domain-containing protein [Planctomycetota bacterium]
MRTPPPQSIHLDRKSSLTLHWADGVTSVIPIALLRRLSPSAEARTIREQLAANPLTVLPQSVGGPLEAVDCELVGNYALRIQFSDGHRTGLYTWDYLREITPSSAG